MTEESFGQLIARRATFGVLQSRQSLEQNNWLRSLVPR